MTAILLSLVFTLTQQGPSKPPAAEKVLQGTIFRADGKPAAGALVWGWKQTGLDFKPARVETLANAQGRYRLNLAAGFWFISSRLGNQGGEAIGPELSLSLRVFENEDPAPIDIPLRERGGLRLKILAEESGDPVAKARVYLSHGAILTTDQQGIAEIGGLPNGCHSLVVLAEGRLTSGRDFCALEKNTMPLEVRLPRAGKIQGKLTDSKGNPVADAAVGMSVYHRAFCKFANYTLTGQDGSYELQGFRKAGLETSLWATTNQAEFYPGSSEDFSSPQDLRRVNMILQSRIVPKQRAEAAEFQPKRIRGTLLDAANKPIPDASLSWTNVKRTHRYQTRSNDRGEFQLTVTPDRGALAILAPGFVPHLMATEGPGEVVFQEPLKSGQTVNGVLVDDRGQPISGAWMAATKQGHYAPWKEQAVRTDAKGRFQLTGWDDKLSCCIVHPDLRSLFVANFKSSQEENRVVFAREGIIKGRLLDSQNQPVRQFAIKIASPDRRQAKPPFGEPVHLHTYSWPIHFSSPDGSFTLTGLPLETDRMIQGLAPGQGDAVFTNVMTRPLNEAATVEPVVVTLAPANSLRLTLVQPDGQPIEGARVLLCKGTASKQPVHWGQDDLWLSDDVILLSQKDGTAHFSAIGQNQGTLLIRAKGWARQAIVWTKESKELTVVMKPEAVLEGQIVNGVSWLGHGGFYSVILRWPHGESIRTNLMLNDQGAFRIAELPPGKCTLETEVVYSPLVDENSQAVELSPGKTLPVRIQWASTPGKDKAGVITK